MRERISKLCAASLRISSNLEPGTVLSEIAECARVLASARYAAIAAKDEAGNPVELVIFPASPPKSTGRWRNGPTGPIIPQAALAVHPLVMSQPVLQRKESSCQNAGSSMITKAKR